MKAMKDYRLGQKTKWLIDQFQSKYECCGDKDYSNWFSISWINQKFLDPASDNVKKHMVGGAYIDKNVPWSCCDKSSVRPCVSENVATNQIPLAYVYPKSLTLYKNG